MKLQYVRAFIVLLAGLITLIVNIKTGRDVTISLLIVLIVIVVFYFIGTLVVELIQKSLVSNGDYAESDLQNDSSNSDGESEGADEEASSDDPLEDDYSSMDEEEF